MNRKIINEIESYITSFEQGYKKYKLESFLYEIEELKLAIIRIKKKDFEYLSINEALLLY